MPLELTEAQRQALKVFKPTPLEECNHNGLWRPRMAPSSKLIMVMHCLACGRIGKSVPWKKLGLPEDYVRGLEVVDEEIAVRWAFAKAQRRQEKRERAERSNENLWNCEWFRVLTALVLERDKYICQCCLGLSGLPATKAHHPDYMEIDGIRVGGEPAWKLRAVCEACHQPGPQKAWKPNYHGKRGPVGYEKWPHYSGKERK